ncbi:MAG: DUF1427 family protein [Hyphomicrobiales bacterium]|nr:DUF1427 family protein [Hyphomicrobiales bacterium]
MTGFIVSLLMGLIVGVVYALIQVRSPAPPLIALVGLLGMVLGEQAVDMAKRHFQPPPQTSTAQPPRRRTGASLARPSVGGSHEREACNAAQPAAPHFAVRISRPRSTV